MPFSPPSPRRQRSLAEMSFQLRKIAGPFAWHTTVCFATAAAVIAGCAPKGGALKDEVVEIEEIEMAPAEPAKQEPAAGGAEARKAMDEEKAAADKLIEDAAQSSEPPPAAQKSDPAAEPEMKKDEPEPATEPVAEPEPPAAEPEMKKDEAEPATEPDPAAAEVVTLGDPSLTAGVPGTGPITLEQIEAWLAEPTNHVVLKPELPLGLSQGAGQIQGIVENPLTRAKIELGRQLYFDTRLSADSTISCASCHDPSMGYTAQTKTGVGIGGQQGGRNSPVSFNRILSGQQFWDGRADSLEAQAVGPIANPIEMGFTHEGVVKRLGEIPAYKKQFDAVFGELSIDRVGQAIAAFERVIVTQPSPYDYYEQILPFTKMDEEDIADDEELAAKYAAAKAAAGAHPMSESAKRGRDLFFGKANCTACHVGANLADEKYHNLGVGMTAAEPDLGRFVVTGDDKDTGAFKTPTIRNVALTGPYMHDGSQATLEEVVEWYDKGGHANPHLSDKIKPLNLSDQEEADLVEFMKACTSDTTPVETGRLPIAADL
jgi:cytochrome c peroxidase